MLLLFFLKQHSLCIRFFAYARSHILGSRITMEKEQQQKKYVNIFQSKDIENYVNCINLYRGI